MTFLFVLKMRIIAKEIELNKFKYPQKHNVFIYKAKYKFYKNAVWFLSYNVWSKRIKKNHEKIKEKKIYLNWNYIKKI